MAIPRRTPIVLVALLASAFLLVAAPIAGAQIQRPGSYKGPGDTVPPPSATAPPTTPRPPDYGGPNGPAAGPSVPNTPTPASLPGPGSPGSLFPPPGYPDPTQPATPETPERRPPVTDPTSWQIWWSYNRWAHLREGGLGRLLPSTGTDGFFLGRGETRPLEPQLRAQPDDVRHRVLPALVQLLHGGGSAQLRIQAVHALAKLRGVGGAERQALSSAVIEMTRSGNQDLVEKGLLALGVNGDPLFRTWLIAVLHDTPLAHELLGSQRIGMRTRVFAVYALGLIAERSDVPVLRREILSELVLLLEDERPEVQAAAVLAIGLAPLPMDDELPARDEALSSRTDQVLHLTRLLEDEELDQRVRAQVPRSLTRLLAGAPESLRERVLHTLLVVVGVHSSDPDPVQNAAVQALGELGRSGGEPIDAEVLNELERLAFRASGGRLTRYLATVAYAEAASRKGSGEHPWAGIEPARKVLLRQLVLNRGETLCWTALAVGLLEEHAADRGTAPDPLGAKLLRTLLVKNRGGEPGGALAVALGLMHDAESVDLLLERMRDAGDDEVRGYAALALGMIGAQQAVEPLREICKSSLARPFTLQQSAIALTLLGCQETGARLFELLERSSDPVTQAAIAAALGWTRDPRPLAGLCDRLAAPGRSDASATWTAVAIGRICDEDEVPWVGRLSIGVAYDVELPTLIDPPFLTGLLDMP